MANSYATSVENISGLTVEAIRHYCPAALATAAAPTVSSKYLFIPTTRLIEAYADAGFTPTAVMTARSKNAAGAVSAKHLISFRRTDELSLNSAEVHQVILRNSHNGGGSYHLMAGIFRMVCSNGMIAGDVGGSMRVRHIGDALDEIIANSVKITELSEEVMAVVGSMKSVLLSEREQRLLAQAVLEARYTYHAANLPADFIEGGSTIVEGTITEVTPDPDDEDAVPAAAYRMSATALATYDPTSMLIARRPEDRADDLWTVLNRIQENAVRGGVAGRDPKGHRRQSRPVTEIDIRVRLNQNIWTLGAEVLRLKTGV